MFVYLGNGSKLSLREYERLCGGGGAGGAPCLLRRLYTWKYLYVDDFL